MVLPGSNHAHAAPQHHAIFRLAHVHGADGVEPFGHHLRKVGGDVLDDHDRRHVAGKPWQHRPQGLDAAGGRSDHDQLPRIDPPQQGPDRNNGRRRGERRHRHGRGRGGGHRSRAANGDGGMGGGGGGAWCHHTTITKAGRRRGSLDMEGEFLSQVTDRRAAARLGQHVDRAGLDGVHRQLRPSLRERTDHDHRQRMLRHQNLQEGQPVHPRHLHVEREDVGVEPEDLLAGHIGIAGGPNHLDLRILVERVADRLADQRRIVDDENAKFPGGRCLEGGNGHA